MKNKRAMIWLACFMAPLVLLAIPLTLGFYLVLFGLFWVVVGPSNILLSFLLFYALIVIIFRLSFWIFYNDGKKEEL